MTPNPADTCRPLPDKPTTHAEQGYNELVAPLTGFTAQHSLYSFAELPNFAGLLNRCDWAAAAHPWAAGDVAALRTAPAFVDAAAELFAPLLAGVPLVRFQQIRAPPAHTDKALHRPEADAALMMSLYRTIRAPACEVKERELLMLQPSLKSEASVLCQPSQRCSPLASIRTLCAAFQVTFDHALATNPAAFVLALARHRVTHLTAVPTVLAALAPALEATPGA